MSGKFMMHLNYISDLHGNLKFVNSSCLIVKLFSLSFTIPSKRFTESFELTDLSFKTEHSTSHNHSRFNSTLDSQMKFESKLQFQSVCEWQDYYIDYQGRKKLIYSIEKVSVCF